MAIFGPKSSVNPFEKMSIFRLFEILVFIAYKSVFFVVEYRKRHFRGIYWKIGSKPWVEPVAKISIFRLFNFLFLQPKKAFFRCRISFNTFSWPILPKKQTRKMANLKQNHGLTRLKTCQFFDFLDFLFLQPRKAFYRLRISL